MMFYRARERNPFMQLVRAAARSAHSRFARFHPTAYLSLYAIVGLVIAAGCAWTFAAIADAVPERGAMDRVDSAVAIWLQVHGTERGEALFVGVSWFGSEVLMLLFVVAAIVLARRRDWRWLGLVSVAWGGALLLDAILKTVFRRGRPSFASEFMTDASWSFPSGHALESTVDYGLIAHFLSRRFRERRIAIRAAAISMIAIIGFGRLYLGVHFLSDVVGGYLAGFVWLSVCVAASEFILRRPQRRN
jgi:undecaprenyl-diphosphatase